jgi:uncharacterized protein YbbK (DUF523 family)
MAKIEQERFIVSACLAGVKCRYNGTAYPIEKVIELVAQGKAIPLCPEQLGGIPSPLAPAERVGEKVLTKEGVDLTEQIRHGSEMILAIANSFGCTRAILKSKSPSCGCGLIYDGSFSGKLTPGDGMLAETLKMNGINVVSEEEL